VAGTGETYTYDGDGTRFTRRVGTGPLTRYVSDPAAALPVIVDDGTRAYVYGLGLAYAVAGSALEVYHADRLGSVRELTNGAGAVTATYRTDEWGIPTQNTGSSTQPFGYTGEPVDGTGLVYLRARLYDPSLGRFTSRDTWPGSPGSPVTLNRYAYVGDNPTTRTIPAATSSTRSRTSASSSGTSAPWSSDRRTGLATGPLSASTSSGRRSPARQVSGLPRAPASSPAGSS
jgi:RHS repeat-associated protein